MVLEILCVEPIYPQYSGVLETCLALRYWFFEVFGSESVNSMGVKDHWSMANLDPRGLIGRIYVGDH